jgi:hypothetical protein
MSEELLAKAVQGDLNASEAERLLVLCQEDEVLKERLIRLVQVERLTGLALEEDGHVFSREFSFRMEAEGDDAFSSAVAARLRRRKMVKVVFLIGAMAAVVMLTLFFLVKDERGFVGEVVRVEASDWSSGRTTLKVGDRLRITEGLVELRFHTGVEIVIEAPAEFEVTGENQGFLHHGKLVAEVNDETAHGFSVDGPAGRLVDFGTRFAVAVEEGGEMEVHVIEGAVDATAKGGETSRLKQNEAMRLSDGEAVRMVANIEKFVTRMPDYQSEPPRTVRWSFDETGGSEVFDRGNGLADGLATGHFKSFSGEGDGPRRVEGKFGGALVFDGSDGFVETEFAGVTGSGPRTVAFWVKAPADFDPMQGYGIINWGDVTVPGGAWQISVNGTERDGPLGRLRIGTHWGQVIGTSDLRDGQWHHCAVVMYGDEEGRPNTATHVLLYVDGELEPAARKSMQAVETVSPPFRGNESHGIWLGRNLGFESEGSSSARIYGKFFRGAIDEMVICDMAMTRAQIVRLLEVNEMPEE